jgi:hypothetical protein
MPRETINSRYEGLTYPGGEIADEPKVHVGWGRESQHVEVGVLKHPRDRASGLVEHVDDWHDTKYGWFIQLDREGINRLIRTLRKARDAAFGADA